MDRLIEIEREKKGAAAVRGHQKQAFETFLANSHLLHPSSSRFCPPTAYLTAVRISGRKESAREGA